MKKYTHMLAIVAVMLMLSIVASAASSSASLKINNPVMLSGQKIEPGTYKVSWTTEGDAANVTLTKGKKTVATCKGKLVTLSAKSSYDSLKLVANGNGEQTVAAIHMAGRDVAIVFSE